LAGRRNILLKCVQTKTKFDCISRLIELPIGELMLGSHGKVSARGLIDDVDTSQEQIGGQR